MKHDETLDLCRKSGFSAFKKGDALSIAVMHGIESQICTLEVLNLVKLVEQATLERAAKKCEEISNWRSIWDGGGGASHGADICRQEIRALKDSND